MNFTVTWTPSAESDLAAVWLAAPDRTAVARAAHEIESHLRVAPLELGESRESSVNRIVFWPPLAVLFDVVLDDQIVFVRFVQLVA